MAEHVGDSSVIFLENDWNVTIYKSAELLTPGTNMYFLRGQVEF